MMITDLPYTLTVDGEEKPIHCDFRDIITICNAYKDPDYTPLERTVIMLNNLYVEDFTQFINLDEAIERATWFIDWGKEYEHKEDSLCLMDWEQDYNLIISAVNNKVNVIDVRELPFMHWWTFLGYFSDRGECQFSSVTEIREKLAKGKKLEKWEREIVRENRDTIFLKDKATKQFEEELFGGE